MLVKALDVAKRHVELSLWIVDLNKSDLERWAPERQHNYWGQTWRVIKPVFNKYPSMAVDSSPRSRVRREETGDGFAPGITDSGKCSAIFDNNRTFYTVDWERNVALSMSYGTMIRVLPRFFRRWSDRNVAGH